MKKLFSKFVIVGALNFIVTFVIFTFSLQIIGVKYIYALIVAWCIGILFTYILNFIWVFRPEKMLSFNLYFVKYIFAGGVSVMVNLIFLSALVEIGNYNPFWSQVSLLPLILIFNFSTANWWSMKREH
tara:strand:+ start:2259 stop:2642 length:384 start_codon:yes stop_codon:yes gene_type:complete